MENLRLTWAGELPTWRQANIGDQLEDCYREQSIDLLLITLDPAASTKSPDGPSSESFPG